MVKLKSLSDSKIINVFANICLVLLLIAPLFSTGFLLTTELSMIEDEIVHEGNDVIVYDKIVSDRNHYDSTVVIREAEISDEEADLFKKAINEGHYPVQEIEPLLGVTDNNDVVFVDEDTNRGYLFQVTDTVFTPKGEAFALLHALATMISLLSCSIPAFVFGKWVGFLE